MRRLFLLLLCLFAAACTKGSEAVHKQLVWDSNVETDMKEYRVYACSATPCLASGSPLAVVVHVSTQASHSYVVPHTDQYYVVYAVDTALNVSAPSATVFANVTPPSAPINLRLQ